MSETITKIQSGTAMTKTGKEIPVYKISKFKKNHPQYETEAAEKQRFLAEQEKKPITLSIFKK